MGLFINEKFEGIIREFNRVTPMTDRETSEILRSLFVEKLKRNDFFVNEGQTCKKIAFLNSGMIRHYYLTEKAESTRWMSLQYDFSASLRSSILQKPSVEYLQAVYDCEIVVFDRKAWEYLVENNNAFRKIWIKNIELNYIGIEERVFSQIEKSAEERFEWMLTQQPKFIQQVPVQYVASMLGITPRHLSRLRKQHL